jgi:hypothetical protein
VTATRTAAPAGAAGAAGWAMDVAGAPAAAETAGRAGCVFSQAESASKHARETGMEIDVRIGQSPREPLFTLAIAAKSIMRACRRRQQRQPRAPWR